MGRTLRTQKRVDYANVLSKYDKHSFSGGAGIKKKRSHPAVPGRAKAAPIIKGWPFVGMHQDVEYIDDISADLQWGVRLPDDVRLPFANLDPQGKVKSQGLIQQVPMNGCLNARAHFDAITAKMLTANSNHVITECVGEAAAAMAMLEAGNWEMIWGFHIHAGTGIDQIWRRLANNGKYEYRIVEAKGPEQDLNSGLWVPPNYAQMDFGWVVNHLYSMQQNGHPAGVEVCSALRLAFQVAHANYGGASKSYYGLAPASRHVGSGSRLTGRVITAKWEADGRLRYERSQVIHYL